LSENTWLRSWSHETYLWYDEIVDRDPGAFSTPDYFEQLRSFALTSSGNEKDRFHFTVPTQEWRQLSQSGVSAGYGAEFAVLAAAPPRNVVVAFTEPGSPATTAPANLQRGARLLEIDGVDVINANGDGAIDTLNAGLFPSAPGETHSFTVSDAGLPGTRSFTMASTTVTADPVQNVSTIDLPGGGRVGYLLFNAHIATAEQELVDAIEQLAADNVDDLVLDLRYNGGGFLVIASQLAYMIAGPVPTAGRIFEDIQFNDQHPSTDPVTGAALVPLPFVDETIGLSTTAGIALPILNLPRVFILSGPNTCSASESIINSLRGVGVQVLQFGSTSCGKPYGFYPTDNCGTTYFTIQFRGVNDAGFGDYVDGFAPANSTSPAATLLPGCSVADDFSRSLGDPAEARLAAALNYRDLAICPAPSGLTLKRLAETNGLAPTASDTQPGGARLLRPHWREIRILEPR
jgi:hypothetical protein